MRRCTFEICDHWYNLLPYNCHIWLPVPLRLWTSFRWSFRSVLLSETSKWKHNTFSNQSLVVLQDHFVVWPLLDEKKNNNKIEGFSLLATNVCITLYNEFLQQVFLHTVWQGADLLVSCSSASVGKDVLCFASRLWSWVWHSSTACVLWWDFMFVLRLADVSRTVLLQWCTVTFPGTFPHTQEIFGFSVESMTMCLCRSSLAEELCPQRVGPPDSSEHFSTKYTLSCLFTPYEMELSFPHALRRGGQGCVEVSSFSPSELKLSSVFNITRQNKNMKSHNQVTVYMSSSKGLLIFKIFHSRFSLTVQPSSSSLMITWISGVSQL